jgi:hypothetical protein
MANPGSILSVAVVVQRGVFKLKTSLLYRSIYPGEGQLSLRILTLFVA